MTSRSIFEFSATADSPLLTTTVVEPGKELTYSQRSLVALEELLKKWGLPDSQRHVLRRYSYQLASAGEEGAGSELSSRRYFHSGLASDFLFSFFTSEALQQTCGDTLACCSSPVEGIQFRELRCSWTSLAPLDRLVSGKVVRHGARHEAEESALEAEEWSRLATKGKGSGDAVQFLTQGEDCYPIVKRPEKFIRGDVIVADELRALFLDTFNRTEESLQYFDPEEDDDDDEDDMNFYSSFSSLTRRELSKIFTPEDRQEALYHMLWRLVAGGGSMNQFEDDFMVYKAAARVLFRSLVTSVKVSTEEEGEGEGAKRYVPRVQSFVFEVTGLIQRGGTETLPLWENSDGMVPSNFNYCYVIVNPIQQDVVLWYHSV